MPDEITETFAVFYGDRAISMIKANRWVIDNDILVTSFFYITARNQLLITFRCNMENPFVFDHFYVETGNDVAELLHNAANWIDKTRIKFYPTEKYYDDPHVRVTDHHILDEGVYKIVVYYDRIGDK